MIDTTECEELSGSDAEVNNSSSSSKVVHKLGDLTALIELQYDSVDVTLGIHLLLRVYTHL